MKPDSALALVIQTPRNEANRRSKFATGGIFHTTGSNSADKKAYQAAKNAGEQPARAAVDARKIDYYDNPGANFPHYVIPWAGMPDDKVAWQIAPEADRSWAAGMGNASLQAYDDGSWKRKRAEGGELVDLDAPYQGYERWHEKWSVNSPTALLAHHKTRDPNQLIQVEVVQPVDGPFTDEQHHALARLWVDIATRHGFDMDLHRQALAAAQKTTGTMGWPPVLMTHGDVHPMSRYNGKGEWDAGEAPNFRRDFFWALILNVLQTPSMDPTSGPAPVA